MDNLTPHRMAIAANVRAEVARKGIARSEVADLLGMSQSALSRRLTGTASFSAEDIAALADYLATSVDALLGEVAA